MVIDEFVQNVPVINDIKIYNKIIYFRKPWRSIKGNTVVQTHVLSNAERIKAQLYQLNTAKKVDVLTSFLNCNTDSLWKKFISSYGLLEDTMISKHCYDVEHAEKIEGYFPVASLKGYREIQNKIVEMITFIDDDTGKKSEYLPQLIKMFKSSEDEKFGMTIDEWDKFKKDDLLWIIDDYISELNNECSKVKFIVEHDDFMNFYTAIQYQSLKQVLYVMLRNKITYAGLPKQCEYKNCYTWFDYKPHKKYCCYECASLAQQDNKTKKEKENIKEFVYKKVVAHIYNSASSSNRVKNVMLATNFDYGTWKSEALLIKQGSCEFYNDLDELCRKSCTCKKCSAGIASRFKAEYEQKK